MDSFVRGRE